VTTRDDRQHRSGDAGRPSGTHDLVGYRPSVGPVKAKTKWGGSSSARSDRATSGIGALDSSQDLIREKQPSPTRRLDLTKDARSDELLHILRSCAVRQAEQVTSA